MAWVQLLGLCELELGVFAFFCSFPMLSTQRINQQQKYRKITTNLITPKNMLSKSLILLMVVAVNSAVSMQNVQTCPVVCNGGCNGSQCIISCDELSSCQSAAIACPSDMDCLVLCSAMSTCQDVNIQCPPSRDCTLQCSGESSCDGMLACPADGACDVVCNNTSTCQDLTIVSAACVEGSCEASLDVSCDGEASCQGAKVACPADGPCSTSCSNTSTCQGMHIQCGSGPCSTACTGLASGVESIECQADCSNTCPCESCPSTHSKMQPLAAVTKTTVQSDTDCFQACVPRSCLASFFAAIQEVACPNTNVVARGPLDQHCYQVCVPHSCLQSTFSAIQGSCDATASPKRAIQVQALTSAVASEQTSHRTKAMPQGDADCFEICMPYSCLPSFMAAMSQVSCPNSAAMAQADQDCFEMCVPYTCLQSAFAAMPSSCDATANPKARAMQVQALGDGPIASEYGLIATAAASIVVAVVAVGVAVAAVMYAFVCRQERGQLAPLTQVWGAVLFLPLSLFFWIHNLEGWQLFNCLVSFV